MQFGMRCHDYPCQPPEELFAAIAAGGSETCQLAPQKALPEEARSMPRICQALKISGLKVGVLGCYVELGLADEAGRQKAVKRFLQNLSDARALEAGCVGSETTNRAKQPDVSREEALRALERSLGDILPEAERLGVTVAVEPVFYHTMATPELTRRVLDDMQSKNLKVIWDPVNLISSQDLAPARQTAMWERSAEQFGSRIAAVHIKGLQEKDGALVPDSLLHSQVRLEPVFAVLRQLGYHGPVLREQGTPAGAAADLAQMRAWAQE